MRLFNKWTSLEKVISNISVWLPTCAWFTVQEHTTDIHIPWKESWGCTLSLTPVGNKLFKCKNLETGCIIVVITWISDSFFTMQPCTLKIKKKRYKSNHMYLAYSTRSWLVALLLTLRWKFGWNTHVKRGFHEDNQLIIWCTVFRQCVKDGVRPIWNISRGGLVNQKLWR